MNHLKALSIKFFIQTTVILSFLSIFEEASIPNFLLLSIVTTVLSYVVGDLFVLPRFGHVAAAIADLGFVSLLVWIFAQVFMEIPVIAALTVGLVIAVAEILFHAYMTEYVLRKKVTETKVIPFPTSRLQTEFAREKTIEPERGNKE